MVLNWCSWVIGLVNDKHATNGHSHTTVMQANRLPPSVMWGKSLKSPKGTLVVLGVIDDTTAVS